MVEEILQIGHPTLRQIAKKVELTDINTPVIQNFIDTLITTAKESNGVGIAAPQIGYSLQIVIIASSPNVRYPDAPLMKPVAMINPHIISHSEEMVLGIEGCLSVKEKRGTVNRYQQIEIEYCDRHGQYQRQIYHGFVARIIQHEIDHLQGILFVDRIEDELSKCEV
jgi:peptide deformylase